MRESYWVAGAREYWLVDARGDEPQFDILKSGPRGFVATRKQAGWIKSNILGVSLRLVRGRDEAGNPEFTLETLP